MKISFTQKLAFTAIGALLAITSCKNSPFPGYEKSESGLYSKFYKQDEKGVKPKEGDVVKVIMSYSVSRNGKDSILFDSKKNPNGSGSIEFPLGKTTFKGSFEEALGTMSVGDSASFIISADSVYFKTFMVKELPAYITKGSNLIFEAKLEKITSKEEVEKEQQKKMEEQKAMMEEAKNAEPKALAKYLEDNKITVKPTASGLYYVEKTKGKGGKPVVGDTVKVNYTGRLLSGKVFDTSVESVAKEAGMFDERRPYEPIAFPLGKQQVIAGWEEALALMTPGTKALIVLPSSIAYGEQNAGPIPPYSSLVFEVELVSIKHPSK